MIHAKYLVVDSALWLFWGPFRKIVKLLPLPAVYTLATLVAWFLYIFSGNKIRITCEELCKTYDKGRIRTTVIHSLEIYVKRHFEDLFMGKLTSEHLKRMVTTEGIEHLDHALGEGKGAIIQLCHFGSFMMILPALGFMGYRINQLVGNPELRHHRQIHKYMFNAKVKENSALPVTFLHVDRSVRPVIDVLKRNELVAMALDGRDGKEWVTVPFLGRSANLSPGSIRLASITGAAILPTFMVRRPDNTHTLIIEKPFVLEQREDRPDFLVTNMARLAPIFEEYILRYPSHFAMTLNILKDRADKGIIDVPLFNDDKEKM